MLQTLKTKVSWPLFTSSSYKITLYFCTLVQLLSEEATPVSRVRLKTLILSQLDNKSTHFHEYRKFVTVFTTVSHGSLSRARLIQFVTSHIASQGKLYYYLPSKSRSSNVSLKVFTLTFFCAYPISTMRCSVATGQA
jgi:hypothetical protein